MNKQSLTRAYGNTVVRAKKNSPHIFFGVGVCGSVVSTVLACRATLKLEKQLDQMRLDFDAVKQNKEAIEITDGEYSRKDYFDDLSRVYMKTARTLLKLYGPSVLIGGVSVACLTGSHIQMTRRNAALSGTLALVSQAFNDYRDRVRGEVGEEKELELYRCMEDNIIEVNGKMVHVKTMNPDRPAGFSPYAVCFDEKSHLFQKSIDMNRVIIDVINGQANMNLTAKGHLFLNDVLEDLGLPKTQAGQFVGWVKNSTKGDGYVDFGMFVAANDPASRRPYDQSVWLDFNVDGEIYQLLEED